MYYVLLGELIAYTHLFLITFLACTSIYTNV